MNTSLLLQAAADSQGSLLMTFIPFILIFVIFYFFMIRPQNKKQKETEKMISALKKGDKIVTIGGIHGTVTATREKVVVVKVDDNTRLEFNRSAIASVVDNGKKEKSEKNDKKKKNTVDETSKEIVDETKEADASENK